MPGAGGFHQSAGTACADSEAGTYGLGTVGAQRLRVRWMAVEQHATPTKALLQMERIALLPSIVRAQLDKRTASLQPAASGHAPAGAGAATAAIAAEELVEHETFLAQAASALLGAPPVYLRRRRAVSLGHHPAARAARRRRHHALAALLAHDGCYAAEGRASVPPHIGGAAPTVLPGAPLQTARAAVGFSPPS